MHKISFKNKDGEEFSVYGLVTKSNLFGKHVTIGSFLFSVFERILSFLIMKLIFDYCDISEAKYLKLKIDGSTFYTKMTKKYFKQVDGQCIKIEPFNNDSFYGLKAFTLQQEHLTINRNEIDSYCSVYSDSNDQIFFCYTYFEHQKIRYFYSLNNEAFTQYHGYDDLVSPRQIYENSSGLSTLQRIMRLDIFGKNVMEVQVKSFFRLLFEGMLDPFFIIQVISIIIWIIDYYYYFASTIFVILTLTLSINCYQTRKSLMSLHKMIYHFENIKVLTKDNGIIEDSSINLVPGDVFIIPDSDWAVPCDCVLLSGQCVVNESMLTGESFPTTKVPLASHFKKKKKKIGNLIKPNLFNIQNNKKHVLFSGTCVSQIRSYGDSPILAMSINNGFSSFKGEMIHSVLFPKPVRFAFFIDSLKFLLILTIIALFGVGFSIYKFIELGAYPFLIVRKTLDIFTIVVPPCLPASLAIATIYSIKRLNFSKISCLDPTRISICGKIKAICFDKTGTLTEESIQLMAILTTEDDKTPCNFNNELIHNQTDIFNREIVYCLATCHNLCLIKGEILGDPIDTVLFDYIGWSFKNSGDLTENLNEDTENFNSLNYTTIYPPYIEKSIAVDEETYLDIYTDDNEISNIYGSLSILKVFQFESELQRMMVVVKENKENKIAVYAKGSPEAIMKLCTSESLPKDYCEKLYFYAQKGYRILSICYKDIDDSTPFHVIMRKKREDLESGMTFLGFLLLHNKLKPYSKEVIQNLAEIETRMCMVTGDNLITALSIACECGIINFNDKILQMNVTFKEKSNQLQLMDTSNNLLTHLENEVEMTNSIGNLNISFINHEHEKFLDEIPIYKGSKFTSNHNLPQLVVDGETFGLLKKYGSKVDYNNLLVSGVVFSRMSPQQKAELVKDMQSLGYVVAMVGDGANDCGALKAAHAGLALAASEASIVSPFSTKDGCLTSVIQLLSEGRTSLVTAFSIFKFVILYSMIQFTSVLLLYQSKTNLSDFQFLYIDLFLLGPIVGTMVNLSPANKLCRKRPLGHLVHPRVLVSLLGNFVVQLFFQLGLFFMIDKQYWYIPVVYIKGGELLYKCQENAFLFTTANFLYIFVAISFSLGPPHRLGFYENKKFVSALLLVYAISIGIIFYPGEHLEKILKLAEIPTIQSRFIAFIAVNTVGLFIIFLQYLFENVSIVKNLINLLRFKNKYRNLYKYVVKSLKTNKDLFIDHNDIIMVESTNN